MKPNSTTGSPTEKHSFDDGMAGVSVGVTLRGFRRSPMRDPKAKAPRLQGFHNAGLESKLEAESAANCTKQSQNASTKHQHSAGFWRGMGRRVRRAVDIEGS